MKKIRRNSKKGFTLVELIVVLVILAILAAMLVPALTGYIDKAKKEKDYQAASVVYAAAQAAITDAYGNGKISKPTATGTFASTATGDLAPYAAEVYTLAGVDSGKVTAFTFDYNANLIITSGNVTINNGGQSATYYLRADGTWGDSAT